VLNGKFHNTKSAGKPRTNWEDVVHRDAVQVLGICGWRRRVGFREELRHLLKEARSQKGPWIQSGWMELTFRRTFYYIPRWMIFCHRIDAAGFSVTSVNFQQSTWHHVSEDGYFHTDLPNFFANLRVLYYAIICVTKVSIFTAHIL